MTPELLALVTAATMSAPSAAHSTTITPHEMTLSTPSHQPSPTPATSRYSATTSPPTVAPEEVELVETPSARAARLAKSASPPTNREPLPSTIPSFNFKSPSPEPRPYNSQSSQETAPTTNSTSYSAPSTPHSDGEEEQEGGKYHPHGHQVPHPHFRTNVPPSRRYQSTPATPASQPVHSHAPSEYSEEEDEDDRRPYSGGPMRNKPVQRSRGSRSRSKPTSETPSTRERYGSAGANSKYGPTTCEYVSPYDGIRCDAPLARGYDKPRHLSTVHAREEYDLVMRGMLARESATLFDLVTPDNFYVCLVCRMDFSRKDAMVRHIRNTAKQSRAKHLEARSTAKKRTLGEPIIPHPGVVPKDILNSHRKMLEQMKLNAGALGKNWDIEAMMPRFEDEESRRSAGSGLNRHSQNRRKAMQNTVTDLDLEEAEEEEQDELVHDGPPMET